MKYYNFPAEKDRNCDIKLFASKKIYEGIEQTALQQLFNASKLPGIVSVVGMPDLHQGYGLPIGGIMASDLEQGVISPGAVGFDINCGVRLLQSNLKYSEVKNDLNKILKSFKNEIPAGVGVDSDRKFSKREFKNICEKGIPYLIKTSNKGKLNDISSCEKNGVFSRANMEKVSSEAVKRGITQLGTLGSGNHFVEIQQVEKIYDNSFNFDPENIFFMIHTGSRGFGHQIAQDYINKAKASAGKHGLDFPNKNLASFPVNSTQGQNYQQAMGCAANFAFANRQLLTDKLRKIIQKIYSSSDLNLVKDITHNTAAIETHSISSSTSKKVLVHRKGACKLAEKDTALIPGSMGTSSFVVKSKASEATSLSLTSVAHGAGRVMGRRAAKRNLSREQHQKSLGKVKVVSGSNSNLLDESPLAYKKIKQVIDSLVKTDLAQPVLELKPLAVLKG